MTHRGGPLFMRFELDIRAVCSDDAEVERLVLALDDLDIAPGLEAVAERITERLAKEFPTLLVEVHG